jgi:hypothetical protein
MIEFDENGKYYVKRNLDGHPRRIFIDVFGKEPERGDLIRSDATRNYVNLISKVEEDDTGVIITSVRYYRVHGETYEDYHGESHVIQNGKRARRFYWTKKNQKYRHFCNWHIVREMLVSPHDNSLEIFTRLKELDRLGNKIYYDAGE